MKKLHGNSKRNENIHHLYGILDSEEQDDVFKFGITDDPLEADGLPRRPKDQALFLNRAVRWIRFFVKVFVTNIPGRAKAEEIERAYIDEYRKTHGRNPNGNIK